MSLRSNLLALLRSKKDGRIERDTETLTVKHHRDMIVIAVEKKDLFKHRIPVTLKKTFSFILDKTKIVLYQGQQGFIMNQRLWFEINENEYVGINLTHVNGKTDKWV